MVESAGLGNLLKVNGVHIRPITFGDLFHINNLAVTHCSLKTFGDVDKGDHEQAHHRQLLHFIFLLHSADPGFSQRILDSVMTGSREDGANFSDSEFENEHANQSFRLKAVKERQQRWLVNQRNSKWLVEHNAKRTPDGRPAMVAWAIEMANTVPSPWQRRVGKEIAL